MAFVIELSNLIVFMHSLTLVNVVNGGEHTPPHHGVFQNCGEQSLCSRGLETWRVHPGSETAQEGHSLPHPSIPNSVRRYSAKEQVSLG